MSLHIHTDSPPERTGYRPKQLIKNPTRGLNALDLIYTNSQDIANVGVFDLNISDHDLVLSQNRKTQLRENKSVFLADPTINLCTIID